MAGFEVLNDPSAGTNAATFVEQARLDSGDMSTLAAGIGGNGVISGCAVTLQSGTQLSVGGAVYSQATLLTSVGATSYPTAMEAVFTIPDSVEVGNLLVVGVSALQTESDTWTPPDDWDEILVEDTDGANFGNLAAAFYKVAVTGDAGSSVTFSYNENGGEISGIMAVCDSAGVDQSAGVIASAASSITSDSVTLTSLETVLTFVSYIVYQQEEPSGAESFGYTGDGTIELTVNGESANLGGLSLLLHQQSSGASAEETFTIADPAELVALTISLQPAATDETNDIIFLDTEQVAVTPASNLVVATPDDTNDRVDLVVAGSDGTCAIVEGTPAAVAVWPTIPASSVLLAAVTVPSSSGSSGIRTSAPLLRDVASTDVGGALTIPESVQDGDLLFGFATSDYTLPSGWNAIPTVSYSGLNYASLYQCYRVAETGDAGTSVTFSTLNSSAVVAFYNVDNDLFVSGLNGATEGLGNVSSNGYAGTQSTASVAATDAYSLIVGAFSYDSNGITDTTTISSPATSLVSAEQSSIGLAVGSLPGSTSDQAITATAGGGGWATAVFALEGALTTALTADNIVDKRVFVSAPVVGNVPSVASSAPSAASVGFYFDTTLNQLGVSDGSYWHYYEEVSNTVPESDPFVDSASTAFSSTATSVALTIPDTFEAGNFMILAVSCAAALTLSGGSGVTWNQLYAWDTAYGAEGSARVEVYSRAVSDGDPGATLTISSTGNPGLGLYTGGAAALVGYSGNPEPSVDVSGETDNGSNNNAGSSTPFTGPVVTTSGALERLVTVIVGAATVSLSETSGTTQRIYVNNTAVSGADSMLIVDSQQTSAGESTPVSVSMPDNGSILIFTVALEQ